MLARFLASVRTLPRAIGAGGLLVLCPAMVAGCVLDREGRSLFSEDTVGATTGSGASGQGGGFTSNAASGSLGMTVSSSSAGAGPSAVCGDGQLNDAESCDDGNVVGGDGCSAECQIENGWMCQGQPSECAEPQTFSEDPTDKKVTKSYVGTIESMECFLFQMKIPETKLLKINATFDIETSKIGDVVIKIESPSKSTGTLLSRPGYDEPLDKGGAGSHGANCNLKGGHPITFDESALDSAEDMGFDANTMQPIKDGDSVCKDEPKICTFKPAPGAAKDDGLNTFVGEDPNGKWYFCVGDADSSLHQTDFREFALTVWAI